MNASARLRLTTAGDASQSLPQYLQGHVIQKNPVSTRLGCPLGLVRGVGLDLDEQRRKLSARAPDCGGYRVGSRACQCRQMVVLDEDPVMEAHPVVDPASAAHRVLLEATPARGGLPGVQNSGPGASSKWT